MGKAIKYIMVGVIAMIVASGVYVAINRHSSQQREREYVLAREFEEREENRFKAETADYYAAAVLNKNVAAIEAKEEEAEKRKVDAKKFEEEALDAYDLGKNEKAISLMNKSLALEDSAAKRRLLKSFKENDDKPTKARKLAKTAYMEFEEGNYREAKELCRDALKIVDLEEIRELSKKIENALANEDWYKTYPAGTRKSLTVDGVTYTFVYCPPLPTSFKGKGFWTLETEATVEMFRSFVEATNYRVGSGRDGKGGSGYNDYGRWVQSLNWDWKKPGIAQTDKSPVVQIDYYAAVAFCEWLEGETGLPVRLPKEAEWQWAACAGEDEGFSRKYKNNVTKYANVADASLARRYKNMNFDFDGDDGFAFTAPVKSFEPNGKLYDMRGNVWEICDDYHEKKVEGRRMRVICGGSWNFEAEESQGDSRSYYSSFDRGNNVGFRPIIRL